MGCGPAPTLPVGKATSTSASSASAASSRRRLLIEEVQLAFRVFLKVAYIYFKRDKLVGSASLETVL